MPTSARPIPANSIAFPISLFTVPRAMSISSQHESRGKVKTRSPGNSACSAARPSSVRVSRPAPSLTRRPFATSAVTVSPVTPARCQSVPLPTRNRSRRSRTRSRLGHHSAWLADSDIDEAGLGFIGIPPSASYATAPRSRAEGIK